jgi:hypothetical protein
MKRVNVVIVHFTHGWTQDLITSWKKNIPKEKIIVFNNNPIEKQIVYKTRGSFGNNNYLNKLCQKEISFLKCSDIVDQIIDLPNSTQPVTERLLTHGEALNFIFHWCDKQKIDYITLVEPDCVINGGQWLDRMVSKIHNKWLVGSGDMRVNQNNYVMPLCPTLWSVREVIKIMNDCDLSFEKNITTDANTGQSIMKEILKHNMCESIGFLKDFIHLNDGTRILHKKSCLKIF